MRIRVPQERIEMGYLVKNVNFSVAASLTALRIFGFWPPISLAGTKRLLYFCYGFFCFMFALGMEIGFFEKFISILFLGSYIIWQIIDLFQKWGDLPQMTATACLFLTNLTHLIKVVNLIARRSLIQTIIDNAQSDLTSETSPEAKKTVNSCNFETKKQQILYQLITLATLIGWASAPAKGHLPFPCWYPFNVSTSPAYEIAYSHQVIAILISGYLNIAKDTLVVTLIAQCHCRLKLLGLSLRTICSDMNVPGNCLLSQEKQKVLMSRLRVCVTRHQAALEAAGQLQQAFSEPTFIQFSVSLLIICVTAFQTVSQIGNRVGLLSRALYLLDMMYQLFIYCYHGDQLAEESTAVADAVYEVPWYECRTAVRRSLIIMSVRSHRVALLVAGGFTPLLLSSFMSIIKASYSLFTLLQQVVERN